MLGLSALRMAGAGAFALALAACGQSGQTAPQASAPIAPPPMVETAAASASGAACATSYNSEMGDATLQDAFGDGSYLVAATPGALECTPSLGPDTISGLVSCQVSGPAEIRYTLQDVIYYQIAAGQSATFSAGGEMENGWPPCHINAGAP